MQCLVHDKGKKGLGSLHSVNELLHNVDHNLIA
jgi:hypothetical protein